MLAWGHPICSHPNVLTVGVSLDSASSRESFLFLGWTLPRTLETSCGQLMPTCGQALGTLPPPSTVQGHVPVHSCQLSSAGSHHTPGHTTHMYTHTHTHITAISALTCRLSVCLSLACPGWKEGRILCPDPSGSPLPVLRSHYPTDDHLPPL